MAILRLHGGDGAGGARTRRAAGGGEGSAGRYRGREGEGAPGSVAGTREGGEPRPLAPVLRGPPLLKASLYSEEEEPGAGREQARWGGWRIGMRERAAPGPRIGRAIREGMRCGSTAIAAGIGSVSGIAAVDAEDAGFLFVLEQSDDYAVVAHADSVALRVWC